MRRKLAAGNWKMNGSAATLDMLAQLPVPDGTDVVICPPAPLLYRAVEACPRGIAIGAQACHTDPSGAFTGDISAPMITDAGATYVIVGHSERRAGHAENSRDVRAKALAARTAGLTAIVCLGESAEEREAENTLDIIAGQLSASVPDASTAAGLVVAYEPIWAIGTGAVATPDQIDAVHDFIRDKLVTRLGPAGTNIRLPYGGSG